MCCWRGSRACANCGSSLSEALRNAVGPTLALTGVQFTFLIGGTVIVERIFAYPGIGNHGDRRRDQPRSSADPGPRARVRRALHPDQSCGRSQPLRRSIRGCAMAERAARTRSPRRDRPIRSSDEPQPRSRAACASPRSSFAGGFILFLIVLAVFAPLIAPHDPLEQDLLAGTLPPAGLSPAPSRAFCSAPTVSAATCCRA